MVDLVLMGIKHILHQPMPLHFAVDMGLFAGLCLVQHIMHLASAAAAVGVPEAGKAAIPQPWMRRCAWGVYGVYSTMCSMREGGAEEGGGELGTWT